MIYKIHVHFYFEHDSAIFKSNPPGFFLLFAPAFPSLARGLPLSDVAPPQRCGSPSAMWLPRPRPWGFLLGVDNKAWSGRAG